MGKLSAFLFLSLVTSIAADADIKVALEKSLNFIKSQRNAHTHAWKPKESATAMLGIFSGDPTWRDRGKVDGAKGHNHEVLSTIHGMELGLSSLLLRHGLDEINDALLAQYISALQVSCLNPRDFLGHDLVAEAIERIEEQRPVSVTLGPIILALCNLGVKITNPRTIRFMQRYEIEKDARRQKNYAVYEVERSALNLLAVQCLRSDETNYGEDEEKNIRDAYYSNLGFINDLKPKEGNSFGSLYKDVLLFQSLKKDDPRIPALRKHILSLQKSDGSYGGSVSLTAMTIPVLSNWTAVDIQYSPCTGSPVKDVTPRDFVTLHYEIEESVISKQSIVGKFLAKPNQPLLDALVAFHKEHPEIFDFESFKTPFGEAIKQINGLESDEDVNWTVWRNGKKLIAGLEAISFEDEDTFLFKYDNISVE